MTPDMVLFSLTLIAGFYMAWNIGANDVSTAMGTSVGSGALTLKQAIFIAAILEFCGAFFFGSHVSETMQNGIINSSLFAGNPQELMLGMLSALIGTGIWLQVASYFGWPVSTTHAIVGSIIGFGALIGGWNAVYWDQVFLIVSSWVLSPLFGGLFGYFLFNIIRTQIFYADNPLQAAKKLMPYFVFVVFALLTLMLLFNGLENLDLKIGFSEAALISFLVAAAAALVTKYFIIPQVNDPHHLQPPSSDLKKQIEEAHDQLQKAKLEGEPDRINEIEKLINTLQYSHEFDYTKADFAVIEKMFGWLQILSACLMAFAHGANDVANAIGPLSAALYILKTGSVAIDATIPSWALGLGGLGIVVGLATWGWRVIETIAKKITELTPTRGFAAEFGAAATILFASRFGMPISTTHTLVGAVIGVGLARGIEALNIGMTRDIIGSWIITIPASAVVAVGVFKLLSTFFG